jgi:CheY-like chemotaxis protein
VESVRPSVLVIDDDPANADTLAMVLNVSGFKATAVYSGEHGLELAQQSPFDHLVTDVVMGGMNGIDSAIAIRQMLPNCRILLISGNNDTAELLAMAATKGHVFNILAKPVHPTVLLEQMRAQSSVSALSRSLTAGASPE